MKPVLHKYGRCAAIAMAFLFGFPVYSHAQEPAQGISSGWGLFSFLVFFLFIILAVSLSMVIKTKRMMKETRQKKIRDKQAHFARHLEDLDSQQIEIFLQHRKPKNETGQS